jgi:pullulanase/glycogen debranching enzyme
VTQGITEGRSSPLGATLCLGGANFSVYSKPATAIELLLFDGGNDTRPARVIRIDRSTNRSYHYWHVFVPGVKAGQIYGYRAEGPYDPANGMRFDPAKVLLDPYGRGTVVPKNYSREAGRKGGDNCASAMKNVVVDSHAYDWEGDTPLNRPSSRTIIYEMHVRGFTCHPSSGVPEKKRGTFAGLIEKISYLHELGVTTLVQAFLACQEKSADLTKFSENYPREIFINLVDALSVDKKRNRCKRRTGAAFIYRSGPAEIPRGRARVLDTKKAAGVVSLRHRPTS